MESNISYFDQASAPGWQLLGELELPVGMASERTVNKWLAVILSPLELCEGLMSKVLRSAHEAVGRAMQAEAVKRSEHVHLVIFSPPVPASNLENWGFFRIEKIDRVNEAEAPDYSIEFYLYQEG